MSTSRSGEVYSFALVYIVKLVSGNSSRFREKLIRNTENSDLIPIFSFYFVEYHYLACFAIAYVAIYR